MNNRAIPIPYLKKKMISSSFRIMILVAIFSLITTSEVIASCPLI